MTNSETLLAGLSVSEPHFSPSTDSQCTFYWIAFSSYDLLYLYPICIFIFILICFSTAIFLATLVALHLTPVSESVAGQSFGWRPSSVAWSLRACFHYVLSNESSDGLQKKMHNHIDCICLTFSKICVLKMGPQIACIRKCIFTLWLHLFDFPPICAFKWTPK